MDEDLKEFREKIKENLNTLIENNRLNEAKEILEEYESIVLDDVDIYSIRGSILIMENNIAEAKKILDKGLDRYGENFDILFNLGFLYESTEQVDLAIEYYKRAMKTSDNKEMVNMVFEILKGLNVNENIEEILNSFNRKDNNGKIKVTFFPYKISMWDSLKSIYEAACNDENCIVSVVPIPYYQLSQDNMIETYEGDRFPDNILITHYSEYCIEYEKPDIVFVHNIYDQYNTITRVYERYFTSNIKKYTDMLVYVPYHIPSLFPPFGKNATYTMPSAKNVDKIILINDFLKEVAIEDNIPESKLIALGSPKIDFIISSFKNSNIYPNEWKEKLNGKIVYLLETGCLHFINDPFSKIEELINILNITNLNKKTALIWRPHPLTKTALAKYRPDLLDFYNNLTEKNIKGKNRLYNNVILDETDTYLYAINASDVLISGNSSLLGTYLLTEKKIIFLDKEMPKDSIIPENAFYYFYNEKEPWYELTEKINKGDDPLIAARRGIADRIYKNLDGSCGEKIYSKIKECLIKNKLY
ncbi:hypothetical protein [Clostridium tertium]